MLEKLPVIGAMVLTVAMAVFSGTTPQTYSEPVYFEPLVSSEPDESVDPVSGVAASSPTIVQLSMPGCEPCIRQWAKYRPAWQSVGWRVEKQAGPFDGIDRYPAYRVFHRGKWTTHRGELTNDALREILGQPPRAPVRSATKAAVTTGRDWLIAGRPWSEASLRKHLENDPNHGHGPGSLSQLSLEELRQMHNSEHEAAKVTSLVSSGCPTCPQSTRSRWRR
jgi:hypothetical protein